MSAVLTPTETVAALPMATYAAAETRVVRLPRVFLHPTRKAYLRTALKNLLITPLLPLGCYYGLDATGVTAWLIHGNPVLTQIMGEGFGHAGLCFSLHYVIKAARASWAALIFTPIP